MGKVWKVELRSGARLGLRALAPDLAGALARFLGRRCSARSHALARPFETGPQT